MAFSNDEKQEIKDIVLETMTEQSDAVDYTEQVVEFAPGDEVPIVRNGDGTGEKSYGRAPVSMFGGGGSGGVNGIKVGGSGQVLTPTSGVVTLPAYESGAEKNPVKYLKEAAISQDGNSLTIKDNNNETKTFTPIGGGGSSVTPSDADPLEDGTKSAGSSTSYSRGDHRHPHDTTKADKSEMAITPGTGENSDKTTIQLKDGLSTTVLTQHQDISGKVDKVNGKGLSSNDYTTDEKNKLNDIEAGAEKHKAPTTQEVKNALGTGSGTTKYLREDGEWATPPSGGGGNTADVNYDTTNKKITKTIDGVTSDVVTVATLKTDMNLGNVGNFKAVSTVANQGLSDTEKSNARTNIGAGTSNFSGNYNDLTNKPTIPTVPTNVSAFTNDAGYLTQHQDITGKADKSDTYTKTEVNNLVSNTPESDVIVVDVPSGSDIATYLTNNVPAASRANNLFRVPGDTSYSEWGWNGTTFIKLDEKDYGFDDVPTEGSTNLINSDKISKFVEVKSSNAAEVVAMAFTDSLGNMVLGFGKDGKIYSSLFNTNILAINPDLILQDSFYQRNKHIESTLLGDCSWVSDPWQTQTKKLQLMVITDTHLDFDSMSGPIEGANNFESIDAVVHLGDFCYWTDPSSDTYTSIEPIIETSRKPLFMTPGNHDVGTRSSCVMYTKSDAEIYERFVKPSVDHGWLKSGEYQVNKCYYYHDFEGQNVRLIMLYPYDDGNVFDETYWQAVTYNSSYSNITVKSYSSGEYVNVPGYTKHSFKSVQAVNVTQITSAAGTYIDDFAKVPRYKAVRCYTWYGQEQIDWLCNKLSEAGTLGYTCIIGSHHSFLGTNYSYDKTTRFNNPYVTWSSDAFSSRYSVNDKDIISQIVNAYQNGISINKTVTPISGTGDSDTGVDVTTGVIPPVTINYTFGSSRGKVLFISGHVHKDLIIRSTRYEQTCISFTCGTLKDDSVDDLGRRYLIGNDSKPMDTATALTIDGNKIHLTRIGACVTNRVDANTGKLITKENEILDF